MGGFFLFNLGALLDVEYIIIYCAMYQIMKFSLTSAREHVSQGDFKNGLFHYLVVLKSVDERIKEKYHEEFTNCLKNYVKSFSNKDDVSSHVLALYPQSSAVYLLLAYFKYLRDDLHGAFQYVRTVLEQLYPSEAEMSIARVMEGNLRTHLFPSWHMVMVNDIKRNRAYAEAISRTVAEQDTVLDIGSGSGLLSILASRQSPKVTAIEANKYLFDLSTHIISGNLGEDKAKIKLVNLMSLKYEPEDQEKATVIVSEIMDCCAFGEGMIETFYDAHKRLAAPNCKFIPSSVELFITLYESEDIYKLHNFSEFRSTFTYPKNDGEDEPYWCHYISSFPDARRLSKPTPVVGVNLENIKDLERYMQGVSSVISLEATDSGTANIVVAHFRAVLTEGVILESDEGTFWEQGIYILSNPADVVKGTIVPLSWSLKKNRMSIWNSSECYSSSDVNTVVEQDGIEMMNDMELAQEIISVLPGQFSEVAYSPPELPFAIPFLESGGFSGRYHPKVRGVSVLSKEENGQVRNDVTYDMLVLWPVRADGSLHDKLLEGLGTALFNKYISPLSIFPEKLTCRGYLVSSEDLNRRCRPDPTAHIGVDLSIISSWGLFEYRDLRIDAFEHTVQSEEVTLFEVDFPEFVENEDKILNQVIQVPARNNALIDGMIYWWTTGSYSSKSRKVAAFVFNKPFAAVEGTMVPVQIDLFKYQLMISIASL